MKLLIVLCATVALSAAKPGVLYGNGYAGALGYSAVATAPLAYDSVVAGPVVAAAPAVAAVAPVVAGVKTQYHAQDAHGQASYGHAEPFQSHNAVQDSNGNKVGSFSYVAPNGQVIKTEYVADALGYRVASNALPVGPGAGPVPVQDTPEVIAARAAHLAFHHRGKRGIAAVVGHTPAATSPLSHAAVVAPTALSYASPIAYSTPLVSSYAYGSPVYYSAPAVTYVH